MRAKRIVAIEWLDACSEERWTDIETAENQELTRCLTVGIVLKEHEDRWVVASAIGTDKKGAVEQAATIWAIPKDWIVEVRELGSAEDNPQD